MSPRDAFGPNLRRIRLQRGVSLGQIAQETKVAEDLWDGLEHNDFERWPNGIFARAYIREYARLIGADPDATVDEFCRWFSNGDRRAARVVHEHAAIVGHALEWQDDVPADVDRDRRGAPEGVATAHHTRDARPPMTSLFLRLRRALGRA